MVKDLKTKSILSKASFLSQLVFVTVKITVAFVSLFLSISFKMYKHKCLLEYLIILQYEISITFPPIISQCYITLT